MIRFPDEELPLLDSVTAKMMFNTEGAPPQATRFTTLSAFTPITDDPHKVQEDLHAALKQLTDDIGPIYVGKIRGGIRADQMVWDTRVYLDDDQYETMGITDQQPGEE